MRRTRKPTARRWNACAATWNYGAAWARRPDDTSWNIFPYLRSPKLWTPASTHRDREIRADLDRLGSPGGIGRRHWRGRCIGGSDSAGADLLRILPGTAGRRTRLGVSGPASPDSDLPGVSHQYPAVRAVRLAGLPHRSAVNAQSSRRFGSIGSGWHRLDRGNVRVLHGHRSNLMGRPYATRGPDVGGIPVVRAELLSQSRKRGVSDESLASPDDIGGVVARTGSLAATVRSATLPGSRGTP